MKLPRQRKVKNPTTQWRIPSLHFSKPLLFNHTTVMPPKSLQRWWATLLHNCLGSKSLPLRHCCFTESGEDTTTADFLQCRKIKDTSRGLLCAPTGELHINVHAALNRQMHFFWDPCKGTSALRYLKTFPGLAVCYVRNYTVSTKTAA